MGWEFVGWAERTDLLDVRRVGDGWTGCLKGRDGLGGFEMSADDLGPERAARPE